MYVLFYSRRHLSKMAAEVHAAITDAGMSANDRDFASRLWYDGGFQEWSDAPVTVNPIYQRFGPRTRKLTLTVGTLARFVTLLRRIALLPGANYMNGIADDVETYGVQL